MTLLFAIAYWWLVIFGVVGVVLAATYIFFLAADALGVYPVPRRRSQRPYDWEEIPDLSDPLERQYAMPPVELRGRVR